MSVSRSDATAPAALAVPSPASHRMDPRRGRGLSPKFSAFLCWLLDLPATTDPAIVDAVMTGDCVFVATTVDPSFNHLLGSWQDCKANLRGLGKCLPREPPDGGRADRPGPPRRGLSAFTTSHHPNALNLPVPTRRPSQAGAGRIANAGASPRSGPHPHHEDRHDGNPHHRRTQSRLRGSDQR